MIRNAEKWELFERELTARTPHDVDANFKIAEELYRHARSLGVFPLSDPLDGIALDIRLAQMLNRVPRTA